MGRVQTLPENLINHIAAGEVVERPASVVKELVENALDAQACTIKVIVQQGGTALIQVDDDGIGMDAEDAVQCFTRHATSKLQTLQDLGRLTTMGFRGEALPSIAAVSRVQMISRCPEAVEAIRVTLEAGKFDTVEAYGAPPGTSIQVRDLFYNTPARLKFLKRPATEASYITHCFTGLALAASEVHMTLLLNGRLHTQALPTAAFGDRLDMVFGAGMQDNLLEVEYRGDDLQVYGCIAKATFHRATRRQQFFFVNGRPVQSRTLSHALYETYRTLLPRERHPVAFLFITVPLDEVDVNVHPAKLEVRFRQEARLHDRLRRLLQQRLQDSLEGLPAMSEEVVSPVFEPRPVSQPTPMMWQTSAADTPMQAQTPTRSASWTEPAVSQELGLHAGYPQAGRAILDGNPLGQLHDTYILMQYPDGVFIVDQHAAHERVVYENLWARFQDNLGESQQLLFPVTLDLPGPDPQWVASCLPRLTALGFSLEPFGGDSYRVHSVPALLAERDYAAALMDVFDVLRTPGVDEPMDVALQDIPQVLDRLLTVMACHGAIRAHQRLQEAEIHALMRDLSRTARPFTCPHGRPVLLNVALSEIEKKFLRR
ncbi:MAG: DNA mismatch repair endonuclease MutL [bacterium]|nr:DNA mismatch repair endonuclease MutL [bacterium]